MNEIIDMNFSIRRFVSSKDKDFVKALMIYNEIIPADTKTNSREIIYFVDHNNCCPEREMYFFGLYVENNLVGFLEAGYLFATKAVIIDYIVLKAEYRLNSIYYPLFSLAQRYFSEHLMDCDYIATEVSTKCVEESVDAESYFSKKMLQMEGFRIIAALYFQPRLGMNNIESNFPFQLMIKSTQPIISMKKETYLAIVKSIYFDHYYTWHSIFDLEHKKEYHQHLESEYRIIENAVRCIKGDIKLEGQSPKCEYYKAPDCHFSTSTACIVQKSESKNRPALLIAIPIITVIAFVVSYGLYSLLLYLNIQSEMFSGIFAAITALMIGLFTLAFDRIFKKS